MNQWIAVNEPLLIGNELKYLEECIKTGWISSEGSFVKRFEAEFAARIGQTYGVAVANGSVALDLAMLALDLEPGAEVIMPTFTIISCAAAIVRAGAIPVLIDADPLTWNMDVEQIEAKITFRTKAIMVVHIYGLPVDLDPVLEIADKYGLIIIEDAAEAIGQTYHGRPCGSFGDLSVFSFYANKHITTGEGGMIITNNPIFAERCRSLRNLCFKPERRFVHDELGFNYRLTNIQAALGLAQLERLDQIVDLKKLIGNQYRVLLSDLAEVQQPLGKTEYADNIYWVYSLVLKDCCSQTISEVTTKLHANKIATRPFFWPIHEQPVFKKFGLFKAETYPVAEKIARRGFYLPSGLALTVEQIERVAKTLKSILINR